MTNPPKSTDGKAVPTRRLSRLAELDGMAAGVAGNMIMGEAKQLAAGKRCGVTLKWVRNNYPVDASKTLEFLLICFLTPYKDAAPKIASTKSVLGDSSC